MKKNVLFVSLLCMILFFVFSVLANPSVVLLQPNNALSTSSTPVNFTCSASTDSNLSNITLYGNFSGTWQANESANETENETNASFLINLADGRYAWNCYACNNESNCSFASSNRTLTLDTTGPAINSVSLNASIFKNNTHITVTSNISDSGVGVVSVTANGHTLSYSSGLWVGSILLNDSYSNVSIVANDSLNNTAVDQTTAFLLDDDAPTIHTLTLSQTIVRNNTNVTVAVNTSDPTSYVNTVTANGINLTNSSIDIWSGIITLINSSSNIVTVVSKDPAGNTIINTTTFLIDDLLPNVTIDSPANGITITANELFINWTINESHLSNVTYSLDGSAYSNLISANETNLTNLNSGFHQFTLRVFDSAGNAGYDYLNFTVNIPLNMSNYTEDLQNQNAGAYGFTVTDASNGTECTTNETLNITSLFLDLSFMVNQTNETNGSATSVTFENISAIQANWGVLFTVSNESPNATANITIQGSTPVSIVSIGNANRFIANASAYYGNATFNVLGLNWDYVYYCAADDANACTRVSQCANNRFINQTQIPCYTNTSETISVYVDHFSTIAITIDNILGLVDITGPGNSSSLSSGSNMYFNFSATELVNASFVFDSHSPVYLSTFSTHFSQLLNGTLNYSQLGGYGIITNGQHNITLNITDTKGNKNTFNYSFSVNDTAYPIITRITTYDTTSSTASGTGLVAVDTSEYANCWISTDPATNASSGISLSQLMSGELAKTFSYSFSYSADGTKGPYYVSCKDVLGNAMNYANTTGTITVSVTEAVAPVVAVREDEPLVTATNQTQNTPNATSSRVQNQTNITENTTLKTKTVLLLPGKEIQANSTFETAIRKVLGKEKLDATTLNNLFALSATISGNLDFSRELTTRTNSSTLKLKLKNKGDQKMIDILMHETVPKTFATNDSLMVITLLGKKEIINPDPEYLFYFPSLNSGEQIEITYTVNTKIDSSILDQFALEVYATKLENVTAQNITNAPSEGQEKYFPFWILLLLVALGGMVWGVIVIIKKIKTKNPKNPTSHALQEYHAKGHGHIELHIDKNEKVKK